MDSRNTEALGGEHTSYQGPESTVCLQDRVNGVSNLSPYLIDINRTNIHV